MLYTITANGKSTQINASSAEIAVRSQMCFYGYDTVFTVTDSKGVMENFRKVKSKQAILGYTDLIKEENTMIKNNNISNERLYNLIENALNWASEVSEQTVKDLIKAMEITPDELCIFGFEKEEN